MPTRSELARRLDDQTIFIVRPDETVTSENQRLADLDAIEAAVHPLGRTLVDLYFRIVHPSFPILHKDVFISKHRISHRHFAPSLLAAVYLVALDWKLYDSVLAGSESVPDAAALEKLAEQTINRDMRRPKLSTVEAGLLLLQRHRRPGETSDSNTSSRAFAAQLVTVAQDLGLHLDCSLWSIPSWEMGLRRRLAWAIYMEDRWGAFVHGRPCIIHDEDWEARPCTDSDFPELSPGKEELTSSDMDARIGWDIFGAHIELTRIVTDILRTFYSLKATRAAGLLDEIGIAGAVDLAQPLVLRLRTWYAALPDALHLRTKQRGKLCANGSLHLAYASMEVAIHRALLRALTPDTSEAVRNRVRSAARAKLQAATELLASLEPEHTAAFWGRAAAHQAAHVGSLGALLWATAETAEEMAWCAARVDELRWALRVRGSAAPFARDALWLLEHDIGGIGVVTATHEQPMAPTNMEGEKPDTTEAQHAGNKHQTDHEVTDIKRAKTETQPGHEHEANGSTAVGQIRKRNGSAGNQKQSNSNPGDAEHPGEEPEAPSNILEKGILYFFIRGRVNIEEPHKVDDIARTYLLLRPIATDAKLGSGTLRDAGTTRLLALPKKQLPKSGRERFMAFVDMAGASYDEIKGSFLASSEYETKTAGTRRSPAATPVGEGVYAITSTGRESHLAYVKTLPTKLGEVQQKLGIKDRGSFIITHLDYVNAQVLLVGESSGIEKAVEPQEEETDKEEPLDTLEHLEDEDLKRMRGLPGGQSASIFADLHAQAEDYPELQTTF
ncbi:hypothetical protein O9K51_06916 [Purpureocillium lavendulum]|uniref:Xylanolytic transcriptional activator regulatory domain-containing protein n=1 Tax=Purpureocillium lavendulum TaxID=1247861 RepID=A0AB34FQM6_9HYPO|nr:hypothetical protein O9K51_06916 [Purpureocillium lavendulum]